ncbi:DUF2332 domain-containing protein [Pararhodobacter zhoushanensis]|uniref:DUF2332 family protein n=1 Tax=Pararhodobacter zhoushanensis TaxID=2479545 RepID=A0ABT3H0W3_9RHOB|nr:DUF2332 family protein [Pararhodobacter zhoushanensis]MCW1933458.1 DUF2332 family protein [Pararhodobacter zhoushanensis]
MSDRLRHALRQQADACAGLGSPFMAQLCTLLAERLEPDTALTRRLFDWPGDLTSNAASVSLRLAGALHALVLQGHAGLAAVYPPNACDDDTLWQAVHAALASDAAFIDGFIDSAPQTNEVRRSAVLIATGHWLAARYPLPLVFSELGASAGLNLNWDRFALDLGTTTLGPTDPALTLTPDWRGPHPAPSTVRVTERAGVDLNPIDLTDPAQRLRLLAYLWPDQPHRKALTEAAIAASPPRPAKADAIDWLEPRLTPRPGQLHLIWSTIAWQYFPAAVQARGTALIAAAGATATPDAPLAWLSYEADGQSLGAGLTLRLWPGDQTIDLGRADFHGRWVDWRAP